MAKERTFNAREWKFIESFKGNASEAARLAGYAGNGELAANRLMKRPAIRAAIEKMQNVALETAGKKMGRAIDISRNDIIMGLADLAKSAESDSARVSAWSKLADIFQLSAKIGAKDADIFAGWSDEELEQYRNSGKLPARFGEVVQ